ncbi:MAG: non-hydrolyzing UDP-N-acetylglucosamine 2-epimerase [Myxococcota bacterium]
MSPAAAKQVRVVAVAGARPNFVKIAALLRELESRPGFDVSLVHTGQHYDEAMSKNFFRDLGIREPDLNLEVGSASHGAMTGQILEKMERVLQEDPPDVVTVVGDVNSTVAASLAAVKLQIPVAHVEAGLRSFDRTMPEEINRLLTDAISDWLFVTEPAGRDNLLNEGVPAEKIHFVGNTMIDTLLTHVERARTRPVLEDLGLEPAEYAVLTLHRPSNVDDPGRLRDLFDVLEEIHSELPVVFPTHPRTAAALEGALGGHEPRLRMLPPLGYLDFLRLMADSRLVLTDSGGIQEETTALGVPCLTLRANTERPVTVTHGTNRIVGTDPTAIREEVRKILQGDRQEGAVPELWDGHAAARIADVLERELGEAN